MTGCRRRRSRDPEEQAESEPSTSRRGNVRHILMSSSPPFWNDGIHTVRVGRDAGSTPAPEKRINVTFKRPECLFFGVFHSCSAQPSENLCSRPSRASVLFQDDGPNPDVFRILMFSALPSVIRRHLECFLTPLEPAALTSVCAFRQGSITISFTPPRLSQPAFQRCSGASRLLPVCGS